MAAAAVAITLTVAGTLEAFDVDAQATFKSNLAARLDGISPSDITLQVSAASVRVVATISAPSEAVATAALSELTQMASSTDALSAALGVTVEAIEAAPALIAPPPPLASPPPASPLISTFASALAHAEDTMADDSILVEAAITGGGTLFALALVGGSRYYGAHVSCGQLLAIVFGTADFCSDAVFAYSSWRMLAALLAVPTDQMGIDALARLDAMRSFIQGIAVFCTIFTIAPIVVSIIALLLLIPIWKDHMDQQRFRNSASLCTRFSPLSLTPPPSPLTPHPLPLTPRCVIK